MKALKPLPHAVIDYAWAGAMIAAPWLFGFKNDKKATVHAVSSGAAILGLSLLTRYPLGAAKLIPFPVHGVIETMAGVNTAAAPWLLGFARNDAAKWTHLVSGLGTLAVVAVTDYQAAEQGGEDRTQEQFLGEHDGAGTLGARTEDADSSVEVLADDAADEARSMVSAGSEGFESLPA